jgi:DNA-binding transcriptional regulator PaaX
VTDKLTDVDNIVNSEAPRNRVGKRKSAELVAFLFGLAQRNELPGVALTRLLTDLGLSPSAAKGLIARLLREGHLAGTRRGRGVDYRLHGELRESFRHVVARSEPPSWSGSFHALLYQVPEQHRAFRDKLRRAAVLAGYGLVQQGVLISLTDRVERIADLLTEAPPGCQVFPAKLAMDREAAVRAAAQAWDLAELDSMYRGHLRTVRGALRRLRRPPAANAASMRRFAELVSMPIRDMVWNPGLPADLLPADWTLPALSAAIDEASHVFGPPAAEYVRGLLGAAP